MIGVPITYAGASFDSEPGLTDDERRPVFEAFSAQETSAGIDAGLTIALAGITAGATVIAALGSVWITQRSEGRRAVRAARQARYLSASEPLAEFVVHARHYFETWSEVFRTFASHEGWDGETIMTQGPGRRLDERRTRMDHALARVRVVLDHQEIAAELNEFEAQRQLVMRALEEWDASDEPYALASMILQEGRERCEDAIEASLALQQRAARAIQTA